ncbi:MAG TPA: serine/threonine-protein kinase [Planctomycetota bacterium]|nr:serine/threonine-protein kinase [Planctomycetota bacterium]
MTALRDSVLLMARLAVAERLATEEQTERALETLRCASGNPTSEDLLRVLSHLDEEQRRRLLEIHSRNRAPGGRFGSVLIERGLARREDILDALRLQARRAVEGTHQNLGEILVEQGIVTASQVQALLEDRDVVIRVCPVCSERYNVARDAADPVCPVDGAALQEAPRAALGVAATLDSGGGDLIGRELGRCRIVELLGRGAMGAVYKAKHLGLNRYVAVKLLPSVARDPAVVRRLLFEARTVARLEHPNVVQVYDVGCQDGVFFMVMQLVNGRTLEDRLLEMGRLPIDEAVGVMRDVLRGLEAAHREGIIHRDLKPANILLTQDGVARVTDFGLAQVQESPDELGGMVVGTPCYMAPEQWLGQKVDARSDLYSLGIVFYQLVTGAKPFEGRTLKEVMHQHTQGKAKAPRTVNSDCPPGVQAILGRMMARSPERRYSDATAVLQELERLSRGEDPLALQGSGRRVKCSFCEALNAADATKCSVCGEGLGSTVSAPIEIVLRNDEFACGRCGGVNRRGARACGSCRAPVCSNCRKTTAQVGAYCWSCRETSRAGPRRR